MRRLFFILLTSLALVAPAQAQQVFCSTPAAGDNSNRCAPTNWVNSAVSSALGTVFPVARYGAVGNGTTNDAPAIQAAITAACAANGGTVLFDNKVYAIASTIENSCSAVYLVGQGGGYPINAGTTTDPQTSFKWTGSSGGTMVRFKTAFGSGLATRDGGGLRGIQLNGQASAAIGLEINTFRGLTIENVYGIDATSACFKITSGTSGVDVANAADSQQNTFDRTWCRVIDSAAVQSAHAYVLDGSANANASKNLFLFTNAQVHNGDVYRFESADNNTFVSASGQVTGSGKVFNLKGSGGSAVGGYNNYFYNPGTGTSGQSVVGAAQSGNVFLDIDAANGNTFPTVDSGGAIAGSLAGGTWQTKIGRYVELTNDITYEAAVVKANPITVGTENRLQLSATKTWFGPSIPSPYATLSSGTFELFGSSSGKATIVSQSAAGTPTLTLPTASGTLVASASSPLSVNATTGALSITGAALTKVDDTNVTLTLGGSPTSALVNASSITVGWTGTLAAGRLNSNVVQGVTNDTNVTGSIAAQNLTLGWTGRLALSRFVQGATNTVLANATSGTADFAAFTMPSCSGAGDALKWTTNTGFGCNSAIVAATATIADDTSTNATMYPTWVAAASGANALKVSSTKMRFNPSTGLLTIDNAQSGGIVNPTTPLSMGSFYNIPGSGGTLCPSHWKMYSVEYGIGMSVGGASTGNMNFCAGNSGGYQWFVNGADLSTTASMSLTSAGILKITTTTASTSTTTGAATIAGGLGIAGAAYIGGNVVTSGIFAVGASTGLSVTKTVRASGGAADCTLIYTGGILTGGTC